VKIRIQRWIGNILRRDSNNIAITSLTWTPEGKKRQDRPRTTWVRSAEREQKEMGWQSWKVATTSARDRDGWKAFLNGLRCPARHDEE